MEEYKALLSNNTWDLVPRSPWANVVTSKWILKHKLKVNGSTLVDTQAKVSSDMEAPVTDQTAYRSMAGAL
jgi:hypothetical protein